MAQWYYSIDGEQYGPIDDKDLLRLARAGQLEPEDHVWKEGMSDWKEAATIKGLFKKPQPPQPEPIDAPPPMAPPTDDPTTAPTETFPAVDAAPAAEPTQCHDVDYLLLGDDLQAVEVELDPGETVIAEAGAMNYMDDGITFAATLGDGGDPEEGFFGKLAKAAGRVVTGETLFLTHFTNSSQGKKRVAFASPYPGKIMAINLAEMGGQITVQKEAFLAAALGTTVQIAFNKRLGSGFFGGEGFILQRLSGDGKVFIHAGGTVIEKTLAGEKLLVDTGCLVGFTEGIDYDIQQAGGLKSMLFGGEGLFLASLSGTGTVWLQTLPFARLADRVVSRIPDRNSG